MQFNSGDYKIKGLYWVCGTDEHNKYIVLSKDEFGHGVITIDKKMELDEFIPHVLNKLNEHFFKYLKDHNIEVVPCQESFIRAK